MKYCLLCQQNVHNSAPWCDHRLQTFRPCNVHLISETQAFWYSFALFLLFVFTVCPFGLSIGFTSQYRFQSFFILFFVLQASLCARSIQKFSEFLFYIVFLSFSIIIVPITCYYILLLFIYHIHKFTFLYHSNILRYFYPIYSYIFVWFYSIFNIDGMYVGCNNFDLVQSVESMKSEVVSCRI